VTGDARVLTRDASTVRSGARRRCPPWKEDVRATRRRSLGASNFRRGLSAVSDGARAAPPTGRGETPSRSALGNIQVSTSGSPRRSDVLGHSRYWSHVADTEECSDRWAYASKGRYEMIRFGEPTDRLLLFVSVLCHMGPGRGDGCVRRGRSYGARIFRTTPSRSRTQTS